jgi:hypothetical protein
MTSRLLIVFKRLLIAFFLWYPFWAVISWDWNPSEWGVVSRFFWVLCSLLSWIYSMKKMIESEGGDDEG